MRVEEEVTTTRTGEVAWRHPHHEEVSEMGDGEERWIRMGKG